MKKVIAQIHLWSVVTLLIFSCTNESTEPFPQPPIINECKIEGEQKLFVTDEEGNSSLAVTLKVSVWEDTLQIDYVPEPGYYINNLGYHIAASPSDIPQGPNGFRSYIFKEDGRKIVIDILAKQENFSGLLYMAAFANVGRFDMEPSQNIAAWITRTNKIESESYFFHKLDEVDLAISDTINSGTDSSYFVYDTLRQEEIGQFPSFCLQGDQLMNVGAGHIVKPISAYSIDQPKLDGTIDNPRNLELINWIINQDRSRWLRDDGSPANGADLQKAIWNLIENTGNPSGRFIEGLYDESVASRIVADAKTFGRGFRPLCFQNELFILHKGIIQGPSKIDSTYNSGRYRWPYKYQVSGIVRQINCDDVDRVFSRGSKFREDDPDDEAQILWNLY